MEMNQDTNTRFHGIQRLYGRRAMEVLQDSHVLIVGIGGVGSWAAEALARSGIGAITLMDLDDICVSNVNRQIQALDGTIGQMKVDILGQRLKLINPDLRLTTDASFLSEKNIEKVLTTSYSYVVDAFDDLANKCLLAATCREKKIPLLTVGAAGGRRDPSLITVGDLSQGRNDKLLARMRKRLRAEFQFPQESDFDIRCVYSMERPVFPTADGCLTYEPKDVRRQMDCASGYGAASFVTGSYGFFAAADVVKQLCLRHNIDWI